MASLAPLDWLWRRHSVPCFEGVGSRRHEHVPLWKLAREGRAKARAARPRLTEVQRLVQFAGFPRSGHSLVGAILSAHPAALIAHELDLMGLLEHRLPADAIAGLILANAERFAANGFHWNGLRYQIEWQAPTASTPLRVIGDKKGDWAVRRYARDPDVLKRLDRMGTLRTQWVLVTRNPFDNIAVMSLRTNRLYDRLRIEARDGADFQARLSDAISGGELTDKVLDDMIEDYANLCAATQRLRAETPEQNWLDIEYETFSRNPEDDVKRLFAFAGLDQPHGLVEACARLVRPARSQPRSMIAWTVDQRRRVEALIERHGFLAGYRFEGCEDG